MIGPPEQQFLLNLARASIHHGLRKGESIAVDLTQCPEKLTDPGAAFVTLRIGYKLRGCIGSLEARRPLAEDVAENAWAAAFRDPRFPTLTKAEFEGLHVHVSVLTPPRPMEIESEADLLAQLRPGVDGLIISSSGHRATFLPSVWESLPNRRDFLKELKRKAGLHEDHWSANFRAERYETLGFGDTDTLN